MYSVQSSTGVLVLGTPQAKAETATADGEMPLDVRRTLLSVRKKERMSFSFLGGKSALRPFGALQYHC
jgi:hypothetical protein